MTVERRPAPSLRSILFDAMDRRGIDSERRLAVAAGLSPTTVNLVFRRRVATETTLAKLAAALGVPVTVLREAAGLPRGELGPYIPPPESGQLGQQQRDMIDDLILALVAASPGRADSDVHNSAVRDRPRLVGRLRNPDRPAPPGDPFHPG